MYRGQICNLGFFGGIAFEINGRGGKKTQKMGTIFVGVVGDVFFPKGTFQNSWEGDHPAVMSFWMIRSEPHNLKNPF